MPDARPPSSSVASGPSPEQARMLEYLRSRAAALGPSEVRARIRAAAAELDAQLAVVDEAAARACPRGGNWSIAQVVDHVAQTQIRAADELRHLLAGRRPPAPPVYDALTSGAAAWAPWPELVEGLRSANAELDAVLAGIGVTPPSAGWVRARTILVANRSEPDGTVRPETFAAELDWNEYALVQRLHLLDHRTQVRGLRAALADQA
jgi:DinB superfamily